jgi:hypothetical protein
MPEKHFYARCEMCGPIADGIVGWEINDFHLTYDLDSPLIKELRQHHLNLRAGAHNRFGFFDTQVNAQENKNEVGFMVTGSAVRGTGYISSEMGKETVPR